MILLREIANRGGSLLNARFRRVSLIAALSLSSLLASAPLFAGDMDGVGYALMLGVLYLGVLVLVSLIALWACRLISNRRARTVARWLILLAWYTPVVQMDPDHHSGAFPAFWFWLGSQWEHAGWPGHPMILAYAGALILSAPVVVLWIYLRERERDRSLV